VVDRPDVQLLVQQNEVRPLARLDGADDIVDADGPRRPERRRLDRIRERNAEPDDIDQRVVQGDIRTASVPSSSSVVFSVFSS
jgi:hypothetical protein